MPPATTDQVLRFFFRTGGRISRGEYTLALIVLQAINLAILNELLSRDYVTPAALLLLVIISVPLVVGLVVIMIKRCHDIGLPGTFFLFALIPFVGVIWPLALCFWPGNATANAYGPPPAFLPK